MNTTKTYHFHGWETGTSFHLCTYFIDSSTPFACAKSHGQCQLVWQWCCCKSANGIASRWVCSCSTAHHGTSLISTKSNTHAFRNQSCWKNKASMSKWKRQLCPHLPSRKVFSFETTHTWHSEFWNPTSFTTLALFCIQRSSWSQESLCFWSSSNCGTALPSASSFWKCEKNRGWTKANIEVSLSLSTIHIWFWSSKKRTLLWYSLSEGCKEQGAWGRWTSEGQKKEFFQPKCGIIEKSSCSKRWLGKNYSFAVFS